MVERIFVFTRELFSRALAPTQTQNHKKSFLNENSYWIRKFLKTSEKQIAQSAESLQSVVK